MHEVSCVLLSKDGECGCNPVQDSAQIDVDHHVPVVNTELVEPRNRSDAGVAYEHVEPPEASKCMGDQGLEVGAMTNIGRMR